MAYFAAAKASEDAITILNRALLQGRALSPFEISRIERNLASVKRAGYETEYNTTSACFYAVVGDISNLLDCSRNVFLSKYSSSKDKLQVIFALNNSLRYGDIYEYSSFIDEEEFIYDPSFVDAILGSYIINFDFDKAYQLLSVLDTSVRNNEQIMVTSKLAESMEEFFNSKDKKEEYKTYITSVLNWYSEKLLGEARIALGHSSLNYSFYDDESIDFLSISIEFKDGDFDVLLDLEDELITHISGCDFPSDVKSSISFSMRFKLEGDESGLKDRVENYD